MANENAVLAAIAALGTGLTAKIDANHAEVMGLLDTIALGTGRIESELATVKFDIARIDTKFDRNEARIEALEARP